MALLSRGQFNSCLTCLSGVGLGRSRRGGQRGCDPGRFAHLPRYRSGGSAANDHPAQTHAYQNAVAPLPQLVFGKSVALLLGSIPVAPAGQFKNGRECSLLFDRQRLGLLHGLKLLFKLGKS